MSKVLVFIDTPVRRVDVMLRLSEMHACCMFALRHQQGAMFNLKPTSWMADMYLHLASQSPLSHLLLLKKSWQRGEVETAAYQEKGGSDLLALNK